MSKSVNIVIFYDESIALETYLFILINCIKMDEKNAAKMVLDLASTRELSIGMPSLDIAYKILSAAEDLLSLLGLNLNYHLDTAS